MHLNLGLGFSNQTQGPNFILNSPSNQWLAKADIDGWNDEECTVVLEFTVTDPTAASNEMIFYIGDNDGTGDAFFLQQRSSPAGTRPWRLDGFRSSSNTVRRDMNGLNFNPGRHRVAFSISNTQNIVVFDGIKMASVTGSTNLLPAVMDGISIGRYADPAEISAPSSQPFSGTLHRFEYYDKALPLSTLRGKTRFGEIVTGVTKNNDLNVLVFMGQSNSSGRANSTPTYTNSFDMIANDGALKSYSDPYDVNTGQIFAGLNDSTGPDSGYAGYTIDNLITDVGGEWAPLPANKGNTTAADWAFNSSDDIGYTEGPTDDANNISTGFAAIQQAKLANQHGMLTGVVFHLGESDAVAGTSTATFKENYKNYIDEMRAALGWSVPVVLVSLHDWDSGTTATQANWERISDDIIDMASEVDDALAVDISDLAGIVGDEVHLSDASNQTVGSRISTAIETSSFF